MRQLEEQIRVLVEESMMRKRRRVEPQVPSAISNTPGMQCGNFMIFLSLRFYVKSILWILHSRSAYSAILTHLEALNFDFYEVLHFLNAEN